jgi:hypothetical protein
MNTKRNSIARDVASVGKARMIFTRGTQVLLALCLAIFLPVGPAMPQATNGLISGRVVDPSSAAIPGATVAVINESTGIRESSTQTNTRGYFVFPALLPATYSLTAKKLGFKTLRKTGLVLLAAQRLSVGNLRLTLGSTRTVVTVSGAGTPVQTTSSEISAVISSSQMAALPSLGGDYMTLTEILPGSEYEGWGNAIFSNGSSSATFNGLSSGPGQANMSTYVSTNGTFSSISNVSSDSMPTVMQNIQDVNVLEGSYEAEYGREAGAVINVTTKSGTSQFHGLLYYYGRNEALNANDFFNNRESIPIQRYRYNTAGGTFGGPVYIPHVFAPLRDKLFFFLSYDNEPSTVPVGPDTYLMPTALERTGDFSQSFIPGSSQLFTVLNPTTHQQFPGNIVPTDMINPTMSKVMNLFPMPNFTNRAVSLGDYNYVVSSSQHSPTDTTSLRLDYDPTQKWHVFGRYERSYFGDTGFDVPGIYAGWQTGEDSYDNNHQRIELNGSYIINAHMVNETAYMHDVNHEYNTYPQSTLSQFIASTYGISFAQPYPGNDPLDLMPAMSFNDGPSFSYDPRFPMDDHTWGWSLGDNFTDVVGSHQLKFGIYTDFEQEYQPHHAGSGSFSGDFNFEDPDQNDPLNAGNSFAQALLGDFGTYSVATTRLLDSNIARTLEWYLQDNWQATKRLTFNYGVRFSDDIPQSIAGPDGAELNLSLYKKSDAAPLFQPVLLNGVTETENPETGAFEPAAYEGYFVPGVGSDAPGAVSVGTPEWHGLYNGKGVLPAPRVGFAWDVFGNGKTAVRGGFGMFYSPRTYAGTVYGSIINPPAIFYPTQYYGNVSTYASSTGLLGPSSMDFPEPDAGLPHTEQWSLGFQQEIGFKTVLGASYVGNTAHDLDYDINLDEVPYGAEFLPQNQFDGAPLPTEYYDPYPGYSSIGDYIWGDNSNYNSLQVTLDRRFAHNLTFDAAYTWSKGMDDNRFTTYLPSYLTYGNDSLDMPNRLTVAWVYMLPKATSWNNFFSRNVLDGWEVSGIASFISGSPDSVGFGTTNGENMTGGGDGDQVIVTGNAVLPKGQRTFNRYFNTSVFALPAVYAPGDPLTKTYIGTQWTSSFFGPGVNNWDLSLMKNFRVTEKVNLQLRLEGFNAFNHPSFNGVNTSADFNPTTGQQVNSGFGQINSDMGPRIVQLAGRLSF